MPYPVNWYLNIPYLENSYERSLHVHILCRQDNIRYGSSLKEVTLSLSKKLKIFENRLICLQGMIWNLFANVENLCVILNAVKNILISIDWVITRKKFFFGRFTTKHRLNKCKIKMIVRSDACLKKALVTGNMLPTTERVIKVKCDIKEILWQKVWVSLFTFIFSLIHLHNKWCNTDRRGSHSVIFFFFLIKTRIK
jgi:hypothetical protein